MRQGLHEKWSFIPHHLSMNAAGIKYISQSGDFESIKNTGIDGFMADNESGYIIFGKDHTIAVFHMKFEAKFFDPNFGSGMFFFSF
jgi:hypothetical protein